ncbi:unnamed protein product [Meloidogyne enterolobii]|uniref:Uncharacterized protein n=1 Tax=Meloidogyne enterolobii TaxID=390850 RepID=A0ACB1AKB3_MELEN
MIVSLFELHGNITKHDSNANIFYTVTLAIDTVSFEIFGLYM